MLKKKKTLALILALLLVISLSACDRSGGGPSGEPSESDGPTDKPAVQDPTKEAGDVTEPSASDDKVTDAPTDGQDDPTDATDPTDAEGALKLGLCADAAAIGAAGLSGNGSYRLVFGTADLASALSSGELDAALVPIDAAVRIYDATNGKVSLAAVTASGGWKIVERGSVVRNIWDLAGKTVYVPRESAMAVRLFEYVATGYDFILGDTLKLEEVPTSELANYDLALMPAILAGSTIVRDPETHLALDLGEELENVTGSALLPVGCLIVRSDMDSDDLQALLADLRASQEGLSDNLDKAVSLKMAASQEEAWAAANDSCTFIWYTGAEMRERVENFIELLYSLDPSLIGGHIPDDGFFK